MGIEQMDLTGLLWIITGLWLCFVTAVFVCLQIFVMKLDKKIWHFVPMIFCITSLIYGFLRFKKMIVYYTDTNWLGDGWAWDSLGYCGTAVWGFLSALVTMIVIYAKRKKSGIPTSRKFTKICAVCTVIFLTVFSGFNIYRTISCPFIGKVDYNRQNLLTIGEYMFSSLKYGDIDVNTSVSRKDYGNYVNESIEPSVCYEKY